MLDNLKQYEILLASKSPRRRQLLEELRIPFRVISLGGIKEEFPSTIPTESVAEYLANLKADAYNDVIRPDELLITADTIVICNDKIYGKPHDQEDAIQMLLELSGRTHIVATGVAITTINRRVSFTTKTLVSFAEISYEDARYYVDTFHPLDKAGAYGIQEWIGCIAVEKIEGSFYNVMGLPVHRLYQELKQF
jgi:septum formation protein